MSNIHYISPDILTLERLDFIFKNGLKLALSAASKQAVTDCRTFLETKLAHSDATFYGINTGFGFLQNVQIDNDQLSELQNNLLKSHACGLGEEVPEEIVKLMIMLKIKSLSYGHSGVQIDTVKRLMDMYNAKMYPVIYDSNLHCLNT